MTDLETEIRAAHRRRRTFWPVLAAAVVVAVLAVGTTLLVTHRRGSDSGSGGTFTGSLWRLVSVPVAGTTYPASRQATIGLTPDGTVQAFDKRRLITGRYHVAGHGFRVADSTSAAVGGPDFSDPATNAEERAIAAVMGGRQVSARISDSALVLGVDEDTLRFDRLGPFRRTPTIHPYAAQIVGVDWWLVSVTVDGREYRVPAGPREQPRVTLSADGRFFADDSVNSYDGHYRWAGDGGFRTVDTVRVSALGTVPDATSEVLRRATGSIGSGAIVRADVGQLLVLRVNGYTATYSAHGPARGR